MSSDARTMRIKRIEWAQQAIDGFKVSTGCDDEDVVCDLVANLLHWAESKDQDAVEQARRGLSHYHSERLVSDEDADAGDLGPMFEISIEALRLGE